MLTARAIFGLAGAVLLHFSMTKQVRAISDCMKGAVEPDSS